MEVREEVKFLILALSFSYTVKPLLIPGPQLIPGPHLIPGVVKVLK
jgi:hypothetical protein